MKTDIEIARETKLNKIEDIAEKLGVPRDEVQNYGRYIAKVPIHLIDKKEMDKHNLILVSAITPNKAGVGKTTVSIGLSLGLNKIGKKAVVALREPSLGPCFGMKGGAAGGGYSQVLPMENINLHFTGDFHAVTSAHNMITALLDNYIYQNRNSCEGLKEVKWKRVLDVNDRSLRNIVSGLGGSANGIPTETGFDITAASEIMAILCLATDIDDLKRRVGNILLGYTYDGKPFTVNDMGIAGAITVLLKDALLPNLVQTTENTPAFIHGGPFANIAIGQSSVIADRLALKLFDYHVTESGFAADIGFEKFWNVKTRLSGLTPNVSVLVATVRALKMHGGGPKVTPGAPLPKEYTEENLELLEKGTCNLFHHVNTIKKSGINPVVCINRFYTDTDAEIALLKKLCKEHGVRCAESNHWRYGGEGAIELAKAVVEACEEPVNIKFLYDLDMPLRQRVELIAKEVYGADGVDWAPLATQKAERFESDPKYKDYCTMMVKTHLSLSDDPTKKGVPTGWRLAIRVILEYGGAKFLCPMAGTISMMPGTAANPAYRRIDVDTETGKVSGLF